MDHLFEKQYEYASPKLHIKGIVRPINENSHASTLMSLLKPYDFLSAW